MDAVLERLKAHQASAPRHAVVGTLGQGSMGVVLEVRDADLRRTLAMKRMQPDREADPDPARRRHFVARFLQEAQVTGQLGHPGIPPVHELSLDADGKPFFTMPRIRGQNLGEVIAKARAGEDDWTPRRVLAVLVKVCEAMAFAHAKHVVHRDLKPENVRIGGFGEVYVMDWGLARVLDRETPDIVRWAPARAQSSVRTDRREGDGAPDEVLMTLDGDVLGTPYYMAPEQARGELERVGPRADVYAVGAMLYLLLGGRPPYAPESGRISAHTVLGLVLHGPPSPVRELAPGADPDLVAICEKAMARAPEQRYAGMEELAQDLEAWLGRRPVRAKAPTLRHSLGLFYERHRPATLTAAGALAVLLVSGAVFIARLARERDAKDAALQRSQRRGDAMAAAALEEREKRLWPALPDCAPALEAWLSDAADLLGREAGYRAAAAAAPAADRRELEAILQSEQRVAALRPAVEQRLAQARSIRTRSIGDEADAWRRAIADLSADPRFAGVALTPQLGLVPLGRNEQTGLWEFWHVQSGARCPRGADGGAALDEDAGICLVLLPGGRCTLGAPSGLPGWGAAEAERPFACAPFFLSKFETTQAQWLRATGANPAKFRPGSHTDAPATLLHPVESVSAVECAEVAQRLALALPSQDQWEYAARAGGADLYAYGAEPAALEGQENVRDAGAWGTQSALHAAPWADGYVATSPVGAFGRNAFGLADMLGNVSEWCSDVIRRASPGTLSEPEDGNAAFRGGSWYVPYEYCRASYVNWAVPRTANQTQGVRFARALE